MLIAISVKYTLFTLEDLYGLKITELDGEVCLHLDKGVDTNYITMFEIFTAWKEQAQKFKNGEISKEEYDAWRYNYPKKRKSLTLHKNKHKKGVTDCKSQ